MVNLVTAGDTPVRACLRRSTAIHGESRSITVDLGQSWDARKRALANHKASPELLACLVVAKSGNGRVHTVPIGQPGNLA